MSRDVSPFEDVDSDDEQDWEEVQVPATEHLEITIQAKPKDVQSKKQGVSHAERLSRIDCHKMHTICLLVNARARNYWLNDELLQARLLSLTPMSLQNGFAMIHKSRQPDQSFRGRLFEGAVARLAEWWCETFFSVEPEGHLRNRTFEDVQQGLLREGLVTPTMSTPDPSPVKGKHKTETRKPAFHPTPLSDAIDIERLQDVIDDDGEQIRSPKSLMKHALMRRGSRDTSAQLFTALCRAVGLPARLVVSLQSVPWQVGVGKPKPKYERKKGKSKETNAQSPADVPIDNETASASLSETDRKGKGKAKDISFPGEGQTLDGPPTKSAKAKGKEKAKPIIKLRKGKDKGNVLGSASPSLSSSALIADPTSTPPVFWTEVFSRADGRWLPVDPIRAIVNKRKAFDPTPASGLPAAASSASNSLFPPTAKKPVRVRSAAKQDNRLVYVLAFEEDGYARDVTRRYAKEFGAKVAKAQGQGGRGKGRIEWWESVVSLVHRPYRLNRDDIEDDELATNQLMEAMPTTIAGFKDHPLYALERHLHQNQAILPPPPETPEIGTFRGEPVYPRSAVVDLKTSENWMRSEGRTVRAGCQPVKMVKVRAGTVGRLRELETLKEAGSGAPGGAEPMQGLYARSQTEEYVPEPVIDGVVPKNNFGNIDLYVPSMLPRGAAHVPYKGTAKVARKLGIDFAEAVTGFEFRNRRANPVIEGVVVAAENEELLLEAFWEAEREAAEKARTQLEERVLKRWKRLIHGLRIRQRLQAQYQADGRTEDPPPDAVPQAHDRLSEGPSTSMDALAGGGFLVDADDVVQAFHLPKNLRPVVATYPPPKPAINGDATKNAPSGDIEADDNFDHGRLLFDTQTMDVDDAELLVETPSGSPVLKRIPKTMAELAGTFDLAGTPEVDAIDNDNPHEAQGDGGASDRDGLDQDGEVTGALSEADRTQGLSQGGLVVVSDGIVARRVTRASQRAPAISHTPPKPPTAASGSSPGNRKARAGRKRPAPRRGPARKRRRANETDEEDGNEDGNENESESEIALRTSDIDFPADPVEEAADDVDGVAPAIVQRDRQQRAGRPSPAKRNRKSAAGNGGTGPGVVKREPRPRAAKFKAQSYQERESEMDEAIRRAIAE